ncbi:unnamed protein product [Paramecium octaurelia]|uniref:Uncharacterized protein n=1 Tax=Paramecium octaurelia TaxID=43137 RepID=A0A8S1YRL8_PAROT|nr:unnamed protein product [Paramecium octaurelia]
MNQNNFLCFEHPKNEVTHICLGKHSCNRLLCENCLNLHQTNNIRVLPMAHFIQEWSLLKSSVSENSKLRAIQIKQIYQNFLYDVRENFKKINDLIDKANIEFEKLISKQNCFDEFQNKNTNFLLEFQEQNLLQAWGLFKSNQLESVQNLYASFEKGAKEFNKLLKANLNVISAIQILKLNQQSQKTTLQQSYQFYCYGDNFQDYQITNFQIKQIGEQEIGFIKEGQVLKIQKITDNYKDECIIKNLEQIKYSEFSEVEIDKNPKTKKMEVRWKGENFNIGGFANQNNNKIGQWREYFGNFWDNSKIISVGCYFKGKRFQKWEEKYVENWKNNYIVEEDQNENEQNAIDNQIKLEQESINQYILGGGYYDEQGLKNSKWIDLHSNFNRQMQIIYRGEYEHDKKIGVWDTIFNNKLIGGGCYYQQGIKNGRWIEHQAKFSEFSQVIYVGEYRQGKKHDQWNAMYRENLQSEYKIVGGGQYNKNGKKYGMWDELPSNYGANFIGKYNGLYEDGKKQGKWDILFENQVIGGGDYNNDGIKTGKWIELMDNFYNQSQVIYVGMYQDGGKIGQWQTLYRWNQTNQFTEIGGGLYDKKSKKKGNWIDIHEQFWNWMQVKFIGGYYKGLKVGKWDTIYDEKVIGGGLYNQDEIKIGKWIELAENYNKACLVTFTGEYQIGIKSGRWNILNEDQVIGGGDYNQEGKKNGQWIDLHENFNNNCVVTYSGIYSNGVKQGRWDITYQNNVIGGGCYDEQGRKFGQWIELDEKFNDSWLNPCKIIYKREYSNGMAKSFGQKEVLI